VEPGGVIQPASGAIMNQPRAGAAEEQIIETMIELARCSKRHRIVVAGARGPHHMLELHRLGYRRVATTATCGLPRGQFDVALVDGELQSIRALETTLDWLVHFLASSGVLVVHVDWQNRAGGQRLESMLERLGFRIEVGTRCGHSLAVLARPQDAGQQVMAA
jgi:hypothetical protein